MAPKAGRRRHAAKAQANPGADGTLSEQENGTVLDGDVLGPDDPDYGEGANNPAASDEEWNSADPELQESAAAGEAEAAEDDPDDEPEAPAPKSRRRKAASEPQEPANEDAENPRARVGGNYHAEGHTVAKEQLLSIIERIERLEEEKKAVADDIKDVYAEAKGNGYDVKTLRKIIAIRKMDAAKRAEELAMLDLYMTALGMAD